MEKIKGNLPTFDTDRGPRERRRRKMVKARPIRLLAAATMALFLFLVVQIMRRPSKIEMPGKGGENTSGLARDPNLDGRQRRGWGQRGVD